VTRVPPWRCAVLAATIALVGAAIARADAAAPTDAPAAIHFFAADTSEAGVISLYFFGAGGAPVEYFERIGGRLQRLGTRTSARDTATAMKQAVTWRCARLVRRFEATSTLPDGTRASGAYSVRTPSCDTRFELAVPRRLAPGSLAAIRVVDRWGNGGVTPKLCIAPPHRSRACGKLRLRRAVTVVTHRVRVTAPGRWRVELRIGAHQVRRSIAVGVASTAAAPPTTVLATGDSMMQGIDSFLADELGDTATVHSEVRPGTAISKPRTPWTRLPRSQTKRLRQNVTIVAMGANEGFPMTLPDDTARTCCGTGWIAEYGRRVRSDMRTYRRKGRGRVIWLTLPIPKGSRLVADAVNLAVEQAAVGLAGVTVLRIDLFFTPDGYRDVMPYRGRDVRVRERDGIHLNVPGTAIAAKLVAAAVREG
jgi:hypothetical protein